MDPTLNTIMDKLHALSCQMNEMLAKQDKQETATNELKAQLAEVTQQNKNMTRTISQQGERINTCEQALRANSIRILGLPVTRDSSNSEVISSVFSNILLPVLEAAKACGEIDTYPSQRFLIESAFTIPSKNMLSSPVIVKLASSSIKSLIFQFKKEALPSTSEPGASRQRPKYGIYEDLTPANLAQFRSIAEDPRSTAVWTFNGQIKFRVKDSETIYRVRSLGDTVDSITKTSLPSTQ
jgi:hypothetical protein